MKRIAPAKAERVALHLKPELNPLEDDKIRDNVSCCVRTEDYLWLAFDESTHVERLHWTGKTWAEHETYFLGDFIPLKGDEDDEIDIEGMAIWGPHLWVTGSQSRKREEPEEGDDAEDGVKTLGEIKKDKNRYVIARIPCVADESGEYRLYPNCSDPRDPDLELTAKSLKWKPGKYGNILTRAVSKDPLLKPFMKLPCKENGFDVEGIAIHRDRVFLGLRGPVLSGLALVLEIRIKEKSKYLKLEKIGPEGALFRKHFINLAGTGIRELSFSAAGSDLLILSGPTMDLDGTMSLWRVPGGLPDEPVTFTHDPERCYDVSLGSEHGHGLDKAEGIAVLEDERILVVYDAPSEEHRLGKHGLYADIFPKLSPVKGGSS